MKPRPKKIRDRWASGPTLRAAPVRGFIRVTPSPPNPYFGIYGLKRRWLM